MVPKAEDAPVSDPPRGSGANPVDELLDEPELDTVARRIAGLAAAAAPGVSSALLLVSPCADALVLHAGAWQGCLAFDVSAGAMSFRMRPDSPSGVQAPAAALEALRLRRTSFDQQPAAVFFCGSKATVAIPVGPEERPFGVLLVESPTPFSSEQVARVRDVGIRARLPLIKARLYEETRHEPRPILLVGVESEMLERTLRVAVLQTPVLVRGETGTGKELLARALHAWSPRRAGPFEAVNCSTLRGAMAMSEIFGHSRGAFTDAVTDRPGLLDAADGGTLFLDEIEKMPLESQALLLRVLEAQEFSPVGSTRKRRVNVRLVAATNVAIERLMTEGAFLPDLYFRIAAVTLSLSPLRERRSAIPRLALRTLRSLALPADKVMTQRTLAKLQTYAYPGNIRELQNIVAEACVRDKDGSIDLDDLPESVAGIVPPRHAPAFSRDPSADRAGGIEAALRACGGNVRRSALLYGISRARFYVLMRALGIDPDPYRRAKGA